MRAIVLKSKKAFSIVSLTMLMTLSVLSTNSVYAGIDTYTADLDETFAVGGVNFAMTFTSDTTVANFIRSLEKAQSVPGLTGSPDDTAEPVGPGDLNGDGAFDQGLEMVVYPKQAGTGTDSGTNDGTDIDMDVFLDVVLSEPVSELELTISDVDESGTRQDQVTVTGMYMGATVYPTITSNPSAAGATFTVGGVNNNVATAIPGAGNASPDGPTGANRDADDAIMIVTFDQPIDSYQVAYADAREDGANIGGLRGISMMNSFSYCPAPDISGTVFEDADGDGVFSAGDTPISGVTVEIFADDGAGNPTGPALDTQITNGTGDYTFADLDSSTNYVIVETDPAGYTSVTDINGDVVIPASNQIPVALGTVDIVDQDFLDVISADVSITKTDGATDYIPGAPFTYTIVASNAGPGPADGSTVADALPGWAVGATWTCGSVTGGAVCPAANGSGNINEVIATFPAGSSVTYTITGTYSPDMAVY